MNFLRSLLNRSPITLGGLLLFGFGFFLVVNYATPQFDLVADILGRSLVVICVLTVLLTFYIGLKTRRHAAVQVSFNGPGISTVDNQLFISLTGVSLPVLFQLRLTPVFDRSGITTATHLVSGRPDYENAARYLVDKQLRFEHRGIWQLEKLLMTVVDVFGIGRFSWELPVGLEVEASAPELITSPIPVVASSYREGEMVQAFERSGEPYDLKPYDPAEGVRRVIWKIFAKTGQLVTRRPELSHVPDGEVCMYMVAGKDDDHVAGTIQHYCQQLVAEDVGFIFGSDGLREEDFRKLYQITTSDLSQATEATVHCINSLVWAGQAGTGRDFSAFLQHLDKINKTISEIIFFGPLDAEWLTVISSKLPASLAATYLPIPNPLKAKVTSLPDLATKTQDRIVNLEVHGVSSPL